MMRNRHIIVFTWGYLHAIFCLPVLTLSILSVFYGISALQTNRPTLMVQKFSALCGWPHWTDVVHELLVLHEAAATEMAGSSVPLDGNGWRGAKSWGPCRLHHLHVHPAWVRPKVVVGAAGVWDGVKV